MANPTVQASLDKSVYRPGDKMTLTVTYADPDTQQVKVNVQVTDSLGNTSPVYSVVAVVDQLTISVTDMGSRTWSKISDNGSVAIFTATA